MILTLVIIAIFIFLGFWLRRSKGRIGEHRVAHILSKLPKDRYRVINNLLLRTSSGSTTQIDHQNIYGNKHTLRNPILQNAGHVRVLRQLLKDYGDIPFIPIVAFSRQASLGISAGTPVIYWNQIWSVISQFKVKRIPPDALPGICNKLIESNIPDSKENRREHIHNVRSYECKRNLAVASGKCPRCGGELVLRHGKYGSFYGCFNYPRCKFTTH